MSRLLSAIMLVSALHCLGACEGGKPPAKSSASEPTPEGQSRTPEGQNRTPVVIEAEGPAPAGTEAERAAAPPWFDAGKIEHVTASKQMASQGKIAGGYASAMVLELEPGVSNEQCMQMARAAIGESVVEVPEASSGDDGRLTLQGKTDSYHYTVVCGEAKGKPTMFMSYTSQ